MASWSPSAIRLINISSVEVSIAAAVRSGDAAAHLLWMKAIVIGIPCDHVPPNKPAAAQKVAPFFADQSTVKIPPCSRRNS
jgi:hypothetical protein